MLNQATFTPLKGKFRCNLCRRHVKQARTEAHRNSHIPAREKPKHLVRPKDPQPERPTRRLGESVYDYYRREEQYYRDFERWERRNPNEKRVQDPPFPSWDSSRGYGWDD